MSDLSLQEKVRWFLNQYPGLSLLLPSFVFILFVLKWWFCSSSNYRKNLPPSPPKFPIIGNLHQLGSLLLHRSLHSLSEKYGPIMLLQLGTKKLLVVTSVDAAHEVLKTHEAAFCGRPDPGVARKIYYNLKNIAFASYGENWKKARSISVLLFLNHKRVQSFRYVREEEVALMVSKIKSSCSSSSEICMDKMLKTLTYDIISRITIGKRYSGEGGNKLAELLLVSTELLGAFNIGDFFPWLGWANHIIGFEAKVKKVKKELDECLENLIDEEESNRQKRGNSINAGEGHHQGKDNQNLLQDLLEYQRTNSAGYALERDSLKAVIVDMILGGSDTYTLLEWAMALLVKHTNVMKNLQKEVKEVAGSKSFISEDDLDNLKYLKAVIKETLRFGHPGTMVQRASTKDVKLMGYDVPAGTEVFVNVWAIARDPTLWEEPEEFRPERFLNNSIDVKGHSFELLPFGTGRRGCPGTTFALIMAELALANLVCHFNFALPGGARAEDLDITEAPGAVIRRKNPLLLVPSLR